MLTGDMVAIWTAMRCMIKARMRGSKTAENLEWCSWFWARSFAITSSPVLVERTTTVYRIVFPCPLVEATRMGMTTLGCVLLVSAICVT